MAGSPRWGVCLTMRNPVRDVLTLIQENRAVMARAASCQLDWRAEDPGLQGVEQSADPHGHLLRGGGLRYPGGAARPARRPSAGAVPGRRGACLAVRTPPAAFP